MFVKLNQLIDNEDCVLASYIRTCVIVYLVKSLTICLGIVNVATNKDKIY